MKEVQRSTRSKMLIEEVQKVKLAYRKGNELFLYIEKASQIIKVINSASKKRFL